TFVYALSCDLSVSPSNSVPSRTIGTPLNSAVPTTLTEPISGRCFDESEAETGAAAWSASSIEATAIVFRTRLWLCISSSSQAADLLVVNIDSILHQLSP